MNSEIRNPRKPFAYYLLIVMLVLFLINTLIVPFFAGQSVKTVDYAAFNLFRPYNLLCSRCLRCRRV